MRMSFAWKLGLVFSLLSVGLSSVCVYSFYVISVRLVLNQIGNNLLHVGRLGVMMLDDEARAAIKRLTVATAGDSIVSPADIAAMPVSTSLESLSPADAARYHASPDFRLLQNTLIKLSLATVQDMEPLQKHYLIDEPLRLINSGAFGCYILVPIAESPNMEVMKYLVSPAPVPTADGWPGNPIGNLARHQGQLDYMVRGKSYTDHREYTDDFYTSLTAAVPILNSDGSTMAILGIDYAATREKNKLYLLRLFCFGLVLSSLLLSLISSYYLARRLSSSLRLMVNAATKVGANDYSVSLPTTTNDEFAIVAKAFNRMVASIRSYLLDLENKNNQIATIILDMHDGIGAILTSIVVNSTPNNRKDASLSQSAINPLVPINNLARAGLSEVRFLMNTLDYDRINCPVIIEEINLQSKDILTPAGIKFELNISGELPETEIDFRQFLQIQRIFREAFVNIVKHADASLCTFSLAIVSTCLSITISDDGNGQIDQTNNGGRGLKNLGERTKQLGGLFTYETNDGFCLHFTFPNFLDASEQDRVTNSNRIKHGL